MTNAPLTRRTHVIRLVGTNRNGDVLQDIWVDVERMDIIKAITQLTENDWQGHQRKFRWKDDPDSQDYDPNGNQARKIDIVKVCSPDESNVNDPDEWIEVSVVKSLKARGGGGTVDSLGIVDRFRDGIGDEDPTETARIFEVRKINHYGTNIDDAAQAVFDADPSRKAYAVAGDQYQRDDSTKDDSQFVDHEILTYLKHRTNESNLNPTIGGINRGRQTKLLNQYMIDESDIASGKVIGSTGINPPYRLDPYQNIVNVNFTPRQQAVLGKGPVAIDDKLKDSATKVSTDGVSWNDGFGGDTLTAASGLGFTVVTSTPELVAFGKPRDGDKCFIAIKRGGSEVRRGIPDKKGGLDWTVVASLPVDTDAGGGAYTISFAGEAFFIAYKAGGLDRSNTFFSISFDGERFLSSIKPFPDVPGGDPDAGGDTPEPQACSVAYDPNAKVYVATGSYIRSYFFKEVFFPGDPPTDVEVGESNFMWSTSIDGLEWSADYDVSQGWGDDGNVKPPAIGAQRSYSSVCFGAGLFVAATYFKLRFSDSINGPSLTSVVSACAVATSRDGKSWINQRLPSTVAEPRSLGVSSFDGVSSCINFYKTGGLDANGFPKGFFVVGGFETKSSIIDGLTERAKLWVSSDGLNWSLSRTISDEGDWVLTASNRNQGTLITL